MAQFGAKMPCFKANTENSTGVVIGKLVAANLTVNLASGELYADDTLAEQLSEFASGSVAMETDDIEDPVAKEIYGCEVADKVVKYKQGDTPPLGTLGYYKVLMRKGIKVFKGYVYPKVRAALGSDNAQTRGSSITFGTSQTSFTVFADDTDGTWRETQEFTEESACVTWVKTKCGISEAAAATEPVEGE